jgi:flavin reductase (DIM6/NTAB) family NADH-FMN oxidoreductase RutF
MAGGLPHGTTVSAFASLSMNPPMVLVSLDLGSELLAVVRQTGQFGLNVLGSGQSALAMTFARKGGAGKFADVRWDIEAGVPRLPGAGGFLACRVARLVPGGDHIIVLGDVLTARSGRSEPLTYHGRVFGTHVASRDTSLDGRDQGLPGKPRPTARTARPARAGGGGTPRTPRQPERPAPDGGAPGDGVSRFRWGWLAFVSSPGELATTARGVPRSVTRGRAQGPASGP